MTEDVRLNPRLVGRKCACQGWIIAPQQPGDEAAEQVQKHQLEEPHKSWNRAEWIEANTAQVEVPIATLVKVA